MDSTTAKNGKNVDINDSKVKALSSEFVPLTLDANDDDDDVFNHVSSKSVNNNVASRNDCQFSTSETSSTSSIEDSPPDGGWGWVVVFASFMINLIADGVSLSFGNLFVDLIDYFGESRAKTSWVGSIFFSMPLLAGPIASYLSDRYGCRSMCIAGALLATVAFVGSIFANSLEFLFFTFSLAGLGLALCYVTSIVIVAYYFEKKRSLATGLASCGTGIGTFVFPLLTNYLLNHYAWQGTLLILSGIFLNMVIFGALMRDVEEYSKPSKPRSKSSSSVSNSESGSEEPERLCSSLVQLPTYLCDNIPVEVISEISAKEGGYLNSLFKQQPQLMNSIVADQMKKQAESQRGNKSTNTSFKRKSKSSFRKKNIPPCDPVDGDILPRDMSSSKLEAPGYLRNLRFQRGSITYRNAMLNIKRCRLRASSCPDIYRNSAMTINETKSCVCLNDLKELLLDMFNFSMFTNVKYTLFCLSNFLLYACVDVPYVYIPDHATHQNIDEESASFLISFLGVLNTLGVVIVGYIGDKPWIDSSLLYSGFITISGVMLGIIPWITNYYGLAAAVGIYGFMISANYTLVPIIIVNIISLESFTGAYGLLLLVQGVASLVGPPMAGLLSDVSGNYNTSFFCTGVCVVISGIMVFPIADIFHYEKSTSGSINSVKSNSHLERVKVKESNKQDGSLIKRRIPPSDVPNNEITTPFLCVANGDTPPILKPSTISIFENPLPEV